MSIDKILKRYLPMTETAFYILLSLLNPAMAMALLNMLKKLLMAACS